ncbi:unnamed protein product [Dicrocoelium dendriticum]|nr:unnamed protein product [Dicrocoelium dendriticum]
MCKVVSGTIVVLVNLLFFPISLVLLVVGGLIQWNRQLLVDQVVPIILGDIENQNVREAANTIALEIFSFLASYGLIVFIFGIFFFVIAFCGIFGVCCKSKFLLGTYAALLLIIFSALLIVTIVFGTRSAWFKAQTQLAFRDIIVKHYVVDNERPPNAPLTVLMSAIQKDHQCCGSYDYRDYQDNESFKNQPYKIPASCCKEQNDRTCWMYPTPGNSYMNQGCFQFLWKLADKWYKYILYTLIGLLVLTFTFVTIAIFLLTRYSKRRQFI